MSAHTDPGYNRRQNERLRLDALDRAIRYADDTGASRDTDYVLKTAKKFEAYLRGDES